MACHKIPISAIQEGLGTNISFFTLNPDGNKAIKNQAEILFLYKDFAHVSLNAIEPSSVLITQMQKELKHLDRVKVINEQIALSTSN